MDPLSSLSVATSIVQFVDYSAKLVSGTYKIYKSAAGELDRNAELKTITNQLVALNKGLQKSLEANGSAGSHSAQEQDLYVLCKDCNGVAVELIEVLEKLRGQPQNTWGSFRSALRTTWTEGQVDSMHHRINGFREQISMQILVTLREQVTTLDKRQATDNNGITRSLKNLQERNEQFLRDIDRSMKWQTYVVDAIYKSHLHDTDQNRQLSGMSQHLGRADVSVFTRHLLEELSFGELEDRHDRIAEAHEKTFQWIFQAEASGTWSNFVGWLQGNEPLYWITGKAGAGKSTLVKYICNEPRTENALLRWAAGKPLLQAAFFFWNSGTAMQMSQEGLLRTLLYGILQQRPDLAPLAFPQRLETFVLIPSRNMNPRPWKWSELLKAFRVILEELTKTTKVALFIDGLDEFEGDHRELISLIRSLQQPNVKVCVASRPWVDFEDAFKSSPNLTLEELTYTDIRDYVASELSSNPGFVALSTVEPQYASALIQNVAFKASGVFLWVFLVVRSLRDGLSNGDRLSDLQARLDSLPADLESLFWGIIRQLDALYFERGMQLFQLVREAMVPLTVFEFSYADENSLDGTMSMALGPLSPSMKAARAEMMRRRLNACTKGLLEAAAGTALQSQRIMTKGTVHPTPRLPVADSLVGYLHRTVRDFMQQHDTAMRLQAQIKGPFNVNLQLCLSYTTQLKGLDMKICTEGRFWEIITYGIEYAVRADPLGTQMLCPLLEEIDRSADLQARQPGARFMKKVVSKSAYNGMDEQEKTRSIRHWSATLPEFRKCTTFLEFATRCQLVGYVRAELAKSSLPCQRGDPFPLLYFAIYDHQVLISARDRPACSHTKPSAELVRVLLDHGANPDFVINGQTIRQATAENLRRQPGTEWEKILASYASAKPAMGKQGFKSKAKRLSKVFSLFSIS